MDEDELAFGKACSHIYGDPWREQRYSGAGDVACGTVLALHDETATARTSQSSKFQIGREGHLAGQHVDLRLTASDGCGSVIFDRLQRRAPNIALR